jgi:succinate dehydrogenase flavoprotein subunit
MAVKAYPIEVVNCDVLVVGAGGAGLRAAVEADRHNAHTIILSKVPVTRSHTVAAKGGINAALGNKTEDDWRWHMYDTIKGSDWLADQDSVERLCKHAKDAIIELEQMGMAFTRDKHGKIYQRAYGGQSQAFGKGGMAYRACAAADRTGHTMMHTLYQQALQSGVTIKEDMFCLSLLLKEQICGGVLAWNFEAGILYHFRANSVILATGGYGQAFQETTSSTICTGDGGGLALQANLELQDMEFIQFHPTGLHGTGLLITEGARGEGAILCNAQGERFMERYAPNYLDLASRDIISRAIVSELYAGHGAGTEKDHLYLHLEQLDQEIIDQKLPSVRDVAKKFAGVDVMKEPIPISPSVHYTMGGIPTNKDGQVLSQDTVIEGLYAIGEASCSSVHGANRLGCNSLLELLVFGKIVGKHAASNKSAASITNDSAIDAFEASKKHRGEYKSTDAREKLQAIMQQHAGIVRTKELLTEGLEQTKILYREWRDHSAMNDQSLIWNNELIHSLETEHLFQQALATLTSALYRTESRGAHYREDYPERNDKEWLYHSRYRFNGNMTKTEVRIVDDAHYAPQMRSY